VFAALNRVELALLFVVGVALAVGPRPLALLGLAGALAVLAGNQLGVVRPILRRRSDRVVRWKSTREARSGPDRSG
jgi:hypothetical protein